MQSKNEKKDIVSINRLKSADIEKVTQTSSTNQRKST